MRSDTSDLKLIAFFTLFSSVVIGSGAVAGSALAVAIGAPLLLVIPGCAILSALFPRAVVRDRTGPNNVSRPDRFSTVEWWTLSVGISVMVVPVVALILMAAPVGFGSAELATGLGLVSGGALLVAAGRRRRGPERERFDPEPVDHLRGVRRLFRTDTSTDLVLSVGLAVVLIALLGAGFYAMDGDHRDAEYTELYLVTENDEGEYIASDYPESVEAGTSIPIVAAVGNHENRAMEYTVVIQEQRVVGGEVVERTELRRIDYQLADGQTGYGDRPITPEADEGTVRITYLLFQTNDGEVPDEPTIENADRYVYFWTDVYPSGGELDSEVDTDDDENVEEDEEGTDEDSEEDEAEDEEGTDDDNDEDDAEDEGGTDDDDEAEDED